MDVLVIGAGVVGATISYELARSGASVTLLDSRTPGDGATRASAGVLCPYIEGHPASPLRDLGRESLDLYDDFIVRLRRDSRMDVVYERNGTLEVALDDTQAEQLAAASGALWREGVEARWVPASVIPDLEPRVTPAALGGLLIPMHGYVGVTSLTHAAVAAALSNGAKLVSETGAIHVGPASPGSDRVLVRAADRAWDADVVVLAAGSWSSRVRVEGADAVPVKPIRGQLLQLATAPGTLRHSIWGADGYLVPWADGAVLVGATVEDVGFDESSTEDARRGLLAMARTLVPALGDAAVTDVRVGLRPKLPDDLPIVGRSQAVPGLIYATGHYRNGVLLAPLTAALVSQLAFDPAAATRPAVAPERFQAAGCRL